jgi:Fe2+ transport system protein FeoA
LSDLPPGAYGVVRDLRGDTCFIPVLASLGLTIGAEVNVLRNSGHGPLLFMVRDTCLALGRDEAAGIEIELMATCRDTKSS